ncbi:ABC transporter ATP-binding protein [Thermomicrobium sp.]|jgi:spermidine/putrescine transport system ATP-binding protein|uniref:ABC transporter ATP-binding protein n=1 Tax=Thermomicrobium sp. TaxID=1969469 RepID=UPI001B053C03|nr:ABC transporter ATP-binding protein [Thermomicrobium sp.]MBO9306084.1 ABC transporter ATP-binding protein [Thermomicrobium sp.]MBO9359110.1 ABC transporter ATP-binding protein [Thermomicrobium sp.]
MTMTPTILAIETVCASGMGGMEPLERPIDVELLDVTKVFENGVVAVDRVSLQIYQGEFFSLLGPSGCGKTTTLRMIAGFEHPSAGEVLIEGRRMGHTPPFRRNVNTVFQNYALFPHMTVFDNVAFGLRMKRIPRDEIARRVREALHLVRLSGMEERYPRQLSGGQQQRVALARALVNRPRVLLLDEPLGALDLKLRKEMQLELKHLQMTVGITFIYVTHDQEEALTMSDRIAVMNAGRVLQVGTPMEIYERPASRFVADFIGESNFLRGTVQAASSAAATVVIADRFPVEVPADRQLTVGQEVTVAVRPEKVRLVPVEAPEANGLLHGRIEEVIYIGTDTFYVVRVSDDTTIRVRSQNDRNRLDGGLLLPVGTPVSLTWATDAARILTE